MLTEEKAFEIRENVARIRENMKDYPHVHIMAVIKTRTPEEINFAVRECGITLLGENRVQELLAHYDDLDHSAKLHFIGSLQKNKVKYIIDKVDMIESLDSLSLAAEIDKQAKKAGIKMPVLIELNIGREESKGGIFPEELPALCDALRAYESIVPSGLMTIAPICENKDDYNGYFSEMKRLLDTVFKVKFPESQHPILSMGMSGSFHEALQNGTDIIRIGEGIFGKRGEPYKKI
ncbi:MAG: YggS family pyridoxal phosphate-dependent enzyme [Clostridia bacterium]|nr:YggS family pyridoxal phosphate-dependent enzyme [Clostridia bacterium]